MNIVVFNIFDREPHCEIKKPMNKRNTTYIRNQLLKELESLSQGVDCNLDSLDNAQPDSPDLIDRAARFIDRNLSQNMCDRKTLRIQKIKQALDDLESGEYGICRVCGDDIAIKRLKANPVARQCIDCKTEAETMERLTGGQ